MHVRQHDSIEIKKGKMGYVHNIQDACKCLHSPLGSKEPHHTALNTHE